MSNETSLLPVAAVAVFGFAFAAAIVMVPGFAVAGEVASPPPPAAVAPNCSCPEASGKPTRPKFAGLGGALDESDEVATLISIEQALSGAADGASYVWHRGNGRMSGLVVPQSTFRNADGALCRHIVVMLTTGLETRKTEGNACRSEDGRWALSG